MMTQGDMLVRAARMKLMAEYEEGRRQADMRQRVEQEVAASHPVNGYNGDLFSSHGPNPDLESIRQLRAGDKPLEDPWIDPVSAGAGGFGGSLLRNLLASKVPQALGRSAASGVMGAAADYPIGAATEHIGEKVPGAALPFNVLAGMGSGLTLERMGEQLLTNPKQFAKPLMNETGSLFGGMGAKPALIADSPKPIASAVDWDLPVKDEVYGKLLSYADELKPERELKGLASAQSRERFIRNIEGFRKNQSSGEELYTFLTEFEAPGWNGHNEKGASKLLAKYGIEGIRFGQGIESKYSAFELANKGQVDDIGGMANKTEKDIPNLKTPKIDPDESKWPDEIVHLHAVTNPAKKDRLVKSMQAEGWQGPPILVVDTGNGVFALTGSHRWAAAKDAEIEVPVKYVDFEAVERWAKRKGTTIDDLLNGRDEDRLAALRGIRDKEAAELMKYEIEREGE